jgi:sugar O-acyltransferase (sialic acid O-acetyltransferase NeuD family)
MRIAVIGAGGFAREVKWLIGEVGHEFAGFFVSDLADLGEHDSHAEVAGDLASLTSASDVEALAVGIGNPLVRLRIGRTLKKNAPQFGWPPLVHPSVQAHLPTLGLGEGTILCAGVIATVNVRVEEFSMVNLSCTLGHECVIGPGSVLNPTVNISGGVVLEEKVLVGTGAQILQYVRVGRGATVGAGSVVTKNVDAGMTVVGVPAKTLIR